MFETILKRRKMKVFLMMASVLVVATVVCPAGIQAQQYPNAWQAQAEAQARAWQRMQEDFQRGQAEAQQRMREAWQRTQEAWQRNQEAWQRRQAEALNQLGSLVKRDAEIRQRIDENNAKAYSTIDRVYRPGEKHWSEPTEAQKHMDLGEEWAQRGKYLLDYGIAYDQLRQEAAQRQRQAAARRAENDSRLMGGPNYRPQPRTRATVRDGGPGDRDVPQRLSPASAAVIRDIERQLTNADRGTGGRSSGQSSPSRSESRQSESKSWQDDVREKMDRRP